jgi:hypothetical protein
VKRGFVFAALAAGLLNTAWAGDPLEKLARDFGKSLAVLKKPTVGILSFSYPEGRVSSGSTILSERLTTYMAGNKNIRIIERALLKKVLEEQHLAEVGVTDASAAQRVGKILDVDILIVGTLDDLEGGQTELNAHVLRSDTGEVLAARDIVVERFWLDAPHRPRPAILPSDDTIDEPDVKPAPNEAIEIGFPTGGNGGGATLRSYPGRR